MTYDKETDPTGLLGSFNGGSPSIGLLGGRFPFQTPVDPSPPQTTSAAPLSDVMDLHRIFQGINDHAATLMALGGGMMTGGIGRGFQAAAAASEHDSKAASETASRQATLRALLFHGVPPATALAAVGNPTVLKAVSAHAFEPAAQPPKMPPMPQTMKVRLAGGGEAEVRWDPGEGRYVQVEEVPADRDGE